MPEYRPFLENHLRKSEIPALPTISELADENRSNYFHEPAKQIPVASQSDVLVCGGGPAGIAAALAAARLGARTTLLECHGALGGVWTAGALSWIIDAAGKQGIMREIIHRLEKMRAHCGAPNTQSFAYDVEKMKVLLDRMCLEAGINVQLHTRIVAAFCDAENRLQTVVTESKSGREAWSADLFVDATGDGDLGALAGCEFEIGKESNGATQPMSLMALLTGLNAPEVSPFIAGSSPEAKKRLLTEMKRAGSTPSYSSPSLFRIYDNLFAMMLNHEYGVSATNAADITKATISARSEIYETIEALRSLGAPWQGLRIVATGAQIGVREGRRIRGLYVVTADDCLRGARHHDAICRVTFNIDVHSTDPAQSRSYEAANELKTLPYDIPLRALIAKNVHGLLLAGRCISGDFLAHASYRVTGNAVRMGEAAGVTAALASRLKVLPQEVSWAEVEQALEL